MRKAEIMIERPCLFNHLKAIPSIMIDGMSPTAPRKPSAPPRVSPPAPLTTPSKDGKLRKSKFELAMDELTNKLW